MKVVDIAIRRKGLAAVGFSPSPSKSIANAEYEGERILLDREILSRLNIKIGDQLSDDDLEKLVLASESYRAKQRAIWLLASRDYSKKALTDKLRQKFSKEASLFALEQMVKRGYLNEERLALNLLEKYSALNLSLKQMRAKLFEKGLEKEVIEKVLLGTHPEDSEYSRLEALIESKYKTKLQNEEGIRKTVDALRRRGFSFSNIKKALSGYKDFD